MSKLLHLDDWRERYFAEPKPAKVTVRRWARSNKIPARKVGGDWYVDEVKWLAGGNRLVEKVLAG